ncbi:phage tail length tape measure family protein [Profundibacter sp.]
MSGAVIGALRVVLGMDSGAFVDGAGRAEKRLNAFRRNMQRTGQQMQRVGVRMSAALTAPLVGLAYKAVAAQKEQEQAIAAVTAALKSMGDGAGYTLSQLEAMASKMQDKSLYGDEDILKKVTANLLTFGNIHDEVFSRAQQLSLDLSARLGQDLQSSAVMLGKALNDPVAGLTALSRVGVSFTEQQKEQIKAMVEVGDVAGAQALMLDELERQYAGQAEALAKTDSGRITQAWNSIGDAMERIGAIILPILADFADYVKSVAEAFQALDPSTQRFVVVAGTIAAALGPVLIGLGLVVSSIGALAGALGIVFAPITAVIVGLAALAAGAVWIYKNWEGVKEFFANLWENIKIGVSAGWQAIKGILDRYSPQWLKDSWMTMIKFYEGLWSLVALPFEFGWSTIKDLLTGNYSSEKLVENLWNALPDWFRTLWTRVTAAFASGWSMIVAEVSTWPAKFVEIGGAIVDGLRQGIIDKWDQFTGWFRSKIDGLIADTKWLFGIQSPSKVFRQIGKFLMEGLGLGVKDGEAGASNALTGAMTRMKDMVGGMAAGGGAGAASGLSSAMSDIGSEIKGVGATGNSVFSKMGRWMADLATGATTLKGTLADLFSNWSRMFGQSAMSGLGSFLTGSLGGGLGGVLTGLVGGLLGFANGGSFDVGGVGGIDSQVVAFRASPNETVHVTKPGQNLGGGGATVVRLEMSPEVEGRIVATAVNKSAQQTVQIVSVATSEQQKGLRGSVNTLSERGTST